MKIKGVDVQNFAWDIIGAYPQLTNEFFTDDHKLSTIQEYFKEYGLSKEEAKSILESINSLLKVS